MESLRKQVLRYGQEIKEKHITQAQAGDEIVGDIILNHPDDVTIMAIDDSPVLEGDKTVKYMAWNFLSFTIRFWTAQNTAHISGLLVDYSGMTPEQFWSNERVIAGIWLQIGRE